MDDFKIFLQIVGIAGGLVAVFKAFQGFTFSRATKWREDYALAPKFLEDLEKDEIHPYTISKGCLALTGRDYPIEELKHLLSYEQPVTAIFNRRDADTYIRYSVDLGKYAWKPEYLTEANRTRSNFLTMTGYIACFLLALSSFLVFTPLRALPCFAVLFYFAIRCLIHHENLKSTMEFMAMPTPNQQPLKEFPKPPPTANSTPAKPTATNTTKTAVQNSGPSP